MKQYGLIGYPLSHSFSKKYFTEKFERAGWDNYYYDLFPIAAVNELPALLASHPFLRGLNVTIPYKEQVLPLLHESSDIVRQVGACNCVAIENGRLIGHNTDVIGFERSLKTKLLPHHTRALIFGTGGAAKAVAWVLSQLQISYWYVSRNPGNNSQSLSYAQVNESLLHSHHLLVNTTPLGMHPNTESYPKIPYECITGNHFLFDLIYNPPETLFLKKGRERGAVIENGAQMLEIQAEESWKIWEKA
jgi:shikimate dehydrogenase